MSTFCPRTSVLESNVKRPRGRQVADAIKAAMKAMMEKGAETPNRERPPNLRQGDARVNCATCQHFQGGLCRLFQYRVTPEQVCDSWSPLPE